MRGVRAAGLLTLIVCVHGALSAGDARGQKVTLPAKLDVPADGPPVPLVATADGANVVWFSPDLGLTVIDGGFFGGDSKRALLFAPKAGRYRVWAVTAKGDKVSERAECLVTVGTPAPVPPVPPGPNPPEPPTPPGDMVFPADGKARVLILYDNAEKDNLPAGVGDVLFGAGFRETLRTKTQNRYRIWPLDQDPAGAGKEWEEAFPKVVKAAGGKPCIALSNGKTGYLGPLPATPEECQKLLEKYGL